MMPKASIKESVNNAEYNAHSFSDLVIRINAMVKAWQDEFHHAAKDAYPHKYWEKTKAISSREGEGNGDEGDEGV